MPRQPADPVPAAGLRSPAAGPPEPAAGPREPARLPRTPQHSPRHPAPNVLPASRSGWASHFQAQALRWLPPPRLLLQAPPARRRAPARVPMPAARRCRLPKAGQLRTRTQRFPQRVCRPFPAPARSPRSTVTFEDSAATKATCPERSLRPAQSTVTTRKIDPGRNQPSRSAKGRGNGDVAREAGETCEFRSTGQVAVVRGSPSTHR